MAIAWGDFDSMALNYIKRLADPKENDPIWIEDGDGGPYAICSYQEWAKLCREHGSGRYRPVSTMTRVEFMGLLLVRYKDFFPEENDVDKKKDISTGELFSSERSTVDAGSDRTEEGGPGEDAVGRQEEDNHRTLH